MGLDQTKDIIELEVRRLLAEGEIEIRRQMAEEIAGHRLFLQGQFKAILAGMAFIFIAGGALLFFFVGESYEKAEQRLVHEVEARAVEYAILDEYKERISKHVNLIVTGPGTKKSISQSVNKAVGDYFENEVRAVVESKVTQQLKEFGSEEVVDTISRLGDISAQNSRSIFELGSSLKRLSDFFGNRFSVTNAKSQQASAASAAVAAMETAEAMKVLVNQVQELERQIEIIKER